MKAKLASRVYMNESSSSNGNAIENIARTRAISRTSFKKSFLRRDPHKLSLIYVWLSSKDYRLDVEGNVSGANKSRV